MPGGLNGNQQNVANALTNFFNPTGGIPLVFGADASGLTQVSGETATGSQQTTFDAMNQFMGVMTDPFIAGRGDGVERRAATPRMPTTVPALTPTHANAPTRRRDAYAMFTKAPLAPTFDPRWSVWAAGFGGSQTTDGNAALGSNSTTSSIAGTAVGADYRFSPFTIAGFALAGGGTSFQRRQWRQRAFRPVPGRRLHPPQRWAGLCLGRARLWLAGHHHQPHRDGCRHRSVARRSSTPMRSRAASKAAIVLSRPGSAASASRLTPPRQFTTFDLPAYAEQRPRRHQHVCAGLWRQERHRYRAANSASAPTNPLRCRTASSRCAAVSPGRMITIPTARSPPRSRRCRAHASSSTARRRRHDSALTTASVEKKWINGWSAAATFEGEFSDVTRSYAGKGVVRYQW